MREGELINVELCILISSDNGTSNFIYFIRERISLKSIVELLSRASSI
jgi:hypothetical protein